MRGHTIYGLNLDVDFPLHEAGSVIPQGSADVTIHSAEPFDIWEPQPVGEVILDFETTNPWYTLVRLEDGSFHFRVHSICDCWISADASRVTLAMHRSAAPGMDAVMTTGTLLSLLLFLRGAPVFHGSAVDVDGRAIAFIGHSGQGKTTMATLFCAEGASVITDDVLVIDDTTTVPAARRGSRELRLRAGIEEVAARVTGATARTSADERLVLAPEATIAETVPLGAIVIPAPSRDGSPLLFRKLRPMDATLALMTFPRLMGWRSEPARRDLLTAASAIATRVPVVIAEVPWGPPFENGLVNKLSDFLARTD